MSPVVFNLELGTPKRTWFSEIWNMVRPMGKVRMKATSLGQNDYIMGCLGATLKGNILLLQWDISEFSVPSKALLVALLAMWSSHEGDK